MVSFKFKLVGLSFSVVLFSFFILQIDFKPTRAEANSWISGQPTIEIGRDATSADNTSPRTCTYATTQFPSYTDNQNRPNPNPRMVVASDCTIAGIGSYVNRGYGYKQQGFGSVSGIPDRAEVLRVASQPVSGVGFGIDNNLNEAGTFVAANPTNLVPTFQLHLPTLLRNDQNKIIVFNPNSYNFSPNGRYIVAEIYNVGIVRIDVESREITLFSTARYTYGMGYDPTPQLGISNDGNTAVVANFEGGSVYVHDISSCTQKTIKSVISENTASGCKPPVDIRPTLRTKFPNFTGLYGINFSANDKSIYGLSGDYNPSTKVRTRKKITINMPGYTRPANSYLAMGDSFASGEGDLGRSYEPGTDDENNKCHLSTKSYPYIVSHTLSLDEFHSVACSGARIHDLLDVRGQYLGQTIKKVAKAERNTDFLKTVFENHKPGYIAQIEHLMNSPPSYITLSIGGNDVGFSGKLAACVTSDYNLLIPDTCKYADDPIARANVAKEIGLQYFSLRNTYAKLAQSTNGQTKIYVMGYPQFVRGEGGNCGRNVHLNDQEREFVFKGVKYMNQVVKAAATDAGAHYIDIEDTLLANNLCSGASDSQMTVNGLTVGNDKGIWISANAGGRIYGGTVGLGNESFHPNQKAQPLIASRLLELTNHDPVNFVTCPSLPSNAVCSPATTAKAPLPDTSYFGQEAYNYVRMMNGDYSQKVSSPPKLEQIISENTPLDTVKLELDQRQPFSQISLIAFSDPVNLGTYQTDSEGKLATDIDLSGKLPPGAHEIHAYTKNIAGEPEELYQHIFITGPDGDINGNNIPDDQEKCGFVPDAGQDIDQDGIDDACDGQISEPPAPEEKETPPSALPTIDNPPSDQKQGLNESVAGWGDEIPLSEQVATSLISTSQGTNSQTSSGASSNQTSSTTSQSDKPIEFNNPRTSSNIANNFNTSQVKGTKPTKIVVPTKPNWFVLIIPLSIILLGTGIFAILRARR